MAIPTVPPSAGLSDGQYIQIEGPDRLLTGFQYDAQQRALYFKESQVVYPSFHGKTHIAEDPVPNATCDSPGLMSPDDKCKLDQLIQTRLGVLGFMGAGWPDDGGWMTGDLILAAGTEFISLERIGNVIRITCDSPLPMSMACFQAGARVLMHDGTTKAIEDIAVGDLVVTANRNAEPVTKTFVNQHNGPVYSFKVDGHKEHAFKVTGNHPFLAIRAADVECIKDRSQKCRHNQWRCKGCQYEQVDRTEPMWVNAEDLREGDFLVTVLAADTVSDTTHIRIADWVRNAAEVDDRVTLTYRNKHNTVQLTSATRLPATIPLSSDVLWLLGAYLAEGHTRDGNIAIFSVHAEELADGDVGAEVIRIANEALGLVASVQPCTGDSVQICLCSSILARLFDAMFGSGAAGKRIPSLLMELHPEDQKHLIRGLFQGDGHRHKKQARLVLELANERLVDQVAGILQRMGHNPSVSVTRHGITKGGMKYTHWVMTVQSSDAQWLDEAMGFGGISKTFSRELRVGRHVLHQIRGVESEPYAGKVYNFEVRREHTYVVNGLACHNCEECLQIFWVQDESDVNAVRPPTCGGKLPGVNSYGELKVYLFPEATIVDPANTQAALRNKGNYPSIIFKRYDDSITPGQAEFEMVLARNPSNRTQTDIGWAFTPGQGRAECVWFMGRDSDGNLVRFDLEKVNTQGVLGALLYNGHSLTKQMAVIVDYEPSIITSGQYRCRLWDVLSEQPVGDQFVATNLWRYDNPEGASGSPTAPRRHIDTTADLIALGTLLDLWCFKIGEIAGTPVKRYYFLKEQTNSAANTWSMMGAVQFGDTLQLRDEIQPDGGTGDKTSFQDVVGGNDFENSIWGLSGNEGPLILYAEVAALGTSGATDYLTQHKATIDPNLPGLRVGFDPGTAPYSSRPVVLHHRMGHPPALLARMEIGRPQFTNFPPYDVLLNAPIDGRPDIVLKIASVGVLSGLNFVQVKGAGYHEIPHRGNLRIIRPADSPTPPLYESNNKIFSYYHKFVSADPTNDMIFLTANSQDNNVYQGRIGDLVELLHDDYQAPCVRLHFSLQPSGEVRLQFRVGLLGMNVPYEADLPSDIDDYVRGLRPGYTVSAVYAQAATWSGSGQQPESNVDGFYIIDGGITGGVERWNILEIMQRDRQVWIWWNGLLVPPSDTLSRALPTPVAAPTPYFDMPPIKAYGKFGMRLWPGATIRRVELRCQPRSFNEFSYGQLELR